MATETPRRSPRLIHPVPAGGILSMTTKTALFAVEPETATTETPKPKSRASKRVLVEETTSTTVSSTAITPSPSQKKKAKRATTNKADTASKTSPPKKPRKTTPAPGSKTPPAGWEELYSLVEELRRDKTAPVDEAGAEVLPEKTASPQVFRFQVLIALMLSSQTKDAVVGDAMRKLQQHGLTVENIAHNTSHEKLNQLIEKVGFHNNKTKYIKEVVQILLEKFHGDIPKTGQEMIDALPGVGPKMAYLVETIAWGTTSGIGVDTHMHRMFNQIKWVTNTKNPEQTRVELEAWLPKDKWSQVNYLWVGFGQETQQQKAKMLRKALDCSRPVEALKLLKRVGLDPIKEGEKAGCLEEVKRVQGRH